MRVEGGAHVVKIGGSLAHSPFLRHWLDVLARLRRHRFVVVPGGGDFADQVRACQRKWKFDQRTAHRMALLAMQQYGLMLASFSPVFSPAGNPAEIDRVLGEERVAVWMPDADELDRAGISSGWEITSDSLSAWLAGRLGAAQLAVVKCSPRSGIVSTPEELARRGILDSRFPRIWMESGVRLRIYHGSEHPAFAVQWGPAADSDQA